MKVTALSRILCASAALGILSTVGVSAAVVRHQPMARSHYQLVYMGAHGGTVARPDFTCPPTYFACVSPTRSSPYTDGWCVSTTGNCTSGLVGNWNWTSVVGKLGKGYKRVKSTWSPDPGNPSTNTISDSRARTKGTKLVASVTHSTCDTSTGTCFSNFVVYGVTN